MRPRSTPSATTGGRARTLEPRAIVEHFTVTPTAAATRELFARDVPDVELKELPGVCAHFLIDRDGTIEQLVPVDTVCRHTVGLNDSAIGVEHVGASDSEVMGNAAQLKASLRLSAWLRCTHGIDVGDVIGHNESRSSRFHHEKVAALADQTHDDFADAGDDALPQAVAPKGLRLGGGEAGERALDVHARQVVPEDPQVGQLLLRPHGRIELVLLGLEVLVGDA